MKKILLFIVAAVMAMNVLADTPEHLYILGDIKDIGWAPGESAEMTKNGDVFTGTYTFTSGTSYFCFATVQGSWDDVNANRYGTTAKITTSSSADLTKGGDGTCATIDAGTYVITVNWATQKVSAALPPLEGREFTEGDKLYFNAGAVDWWTNDNVSQTMYLKKTDHSVISVVGTAVEGKIYEFAIPAGSYNSFYEQRGTWNKTGDITLVGTDKNYIKTFADGSADVTWDTYTPAGPTKETNVYLVGSFNNWNTTSDRFVCEEAGDEVAYCTINVTKYGDIAFKIVDNGSWRNGETSSVTKDNNTVTFLANDQSGYQVLLTPYAAGDYVFAFNLTTSVMTVTYPNGDPMIEEHEVELAGSYNSWGEHSAFTKVDATNYTLVKNFASAPANYEMRVIVDGNWLGADWNITREAPEVELGADKNFTMQIDWAGDYKFAYNTTSKELTVTYPEIPTFTAYFVNSRSYDNVYAYVYASGGYKDWPGEKATATAETKGGYTVYSYEFPSSYTSIIFHDGVNQESKVEKQFDSSKPYMTETGGQYASLSDIPTTDLTVSPYEYNTLYSDKALRIPVGAEAKFISAVDGDALTLTPISGIIPANTAVLIKGAANTAYEFIQVTGGESIGTNYLKGTLEDTEINNDQKHYILALDADDNFGFFWPYGTDEGVGSFTNSATKAYIELSPSTPAPARFLLSGKTTPTALPSIQQTEKAEKCMIDGQLYIIRNNQLYNLQGARLQ